MPPGAGSWRGPQLAERFDWGARTARRRLGKAMSFLDPAEPREHWQRLYRATMARGAELRGCVDRGDERPLQRLAEATTNVCVLASASAAIDSPDAYPPELIGDALAGAEHGAAVAAWLVDLALVAEGRELRYPAGEWRGRAFSYAASRARHDRDSALGATPVLVHNVSLGLAEAMTYTETDPLVTPEAGAMALGDLIELFVRIRGAMAGLPSCL
jgi:hypothetical protein